MLAWARFWLLAKASCASRSAMCRSLIALLQHEGRRRRRESAAAGVSCRRRVPGIQARTSGRRLAAPFQTAASRAVAPKTGRWLDAGRAWESALMEREARPEPRPPRELFSLGASGHRAGGREHSGGWQLDSRALGHCRQGALLLCGTHSLRRKLPSPSEHRAVVIACGRIRWRKVAIVATIGLAPPGTLRWQQQGVLAS